jgi:hypothetical protein
MKSKRTSSFCTLVALLLPFTFTIQSANAQNPEFPKPSLPKPSLPKPNLPKPPDVKPPVIKPPVTSSPNAPVLRPPVPNPNIPRNNAPAAPKYTFTPYPNHLADGNGVVHVPLLQNSSNRLYVWPKTIVPKDIALIKSGALDTLAKLLPPLETFQIKHSEKAFTVTTQKGYELQFPDNAFADGLGNPVLGPITLTVQTFQSKTDFASALLTSSTSSGEALISGGMLDIQAKSGNSDIRMGDGKSFKIIGNNASDSKFEEGFQTFYGIAGDQTTWSETPGNGAGTGNSASTGNGASSGNSNNDALSKNATYTLSLLPITRAYNGVSQPLVVTDNDRTIALSNWFYQNVKISKELKKQIKRDGIIFPAELILNDAGKIVSVRLTDSAQAKNSLISAHFESYRQLLLTAPAARFLDTLPQPKTVVVRFSTLNENFAGTKQIPLPPAMAGVAKMATAQDGKWVLESYSTQLVNCDRFAKFPKTNDSITFSVDHAKAVVFLNFKSYNALLAPSSARIENTGYQYVMKQFPVGATARLIALVYNDQGQVHLEVADVSEGQYHIKNAQKYPLNQLTLKAAFEMMPMDLLPTIK